MKPLTPPMQELLADLGVGPGLASKVGAGLWRCMGAKPDKVHLTQTVRGLVDRGYARWLTVGHTIETTTEGRDEATVCALARAQGGTLERAREVLAELTSTPAMPAWYGDSKPAEAMPRALRSPWEGGYVSLARAAGVDRIEPGCDPKLAPTCASGCPGPGPLLDTGAAPLLRLGEAAPPVKVLRPCSTCAPEFLHREALGRMCTFCGAAATKSQEVLGNPEQLIYACRAKACLQQFRGLVSDNYRPPRRKRRKPRRPKQHTHETRIP